MGLCGASEPFPTDPTAAQQSTKLTGTRKEAGTQDSLQP